jgi:hypothetical protein
MTYKTYGGVDTHIHIFLTSELDIDSSPCRFRLAEISPGSHWIGGQVDSRIHLNNVKKGEPNLYRYRKSNPLAMQFVAILTVHYVYRSI